METNILLETHPYFITKKIVDMYSSQIKFTFSKYIYIPQTTIDSRINFDIDGNEFSWQKLKELINSLKKGQELSLTSRISFANGKIFHIPMIDFYTNNFEDIINSLLENLTNEILDNLYIFNSGNSFHAYSTYLLNENDWIKFMARLLLLNKPLNNCIVDYRWIGHRLLAGYSSLRWSCNTEKSKSYPTLIYSPNRNQKCGLSEPVQ